MQPSEEETLAAQAEELACKALAAARGELGGDWLTVDADRRLLAAQLWIRRKHRPRKLVIAANRRLSRDCVRPVEELILAFLAKNGPSLHVELLEHVNADVRLWVRGLKDRQADGRLPCTHHQLSRRLKELAEVGLVRYTPDRWALIQDSVADP